MMLRDLARKEVVTATPGMDAAEAALTMQREAVGSVVVVRHDKPVGILTDRDIAMAVAADGRGPHEITVEEVMSRELYTLDTDQALEDALDTMDRAGVRRVPLVHNGHLAGIVTMDDLLVHLSRQLADLAGLVERTTGAGLD